MTLREKQSVFARLVASLILKIYRDGYEVTFGEAYRSPEEAQRLAAAGKGIALSLHTQRLAIDLNLFKDGAYVLDGDAYQPFGAWWEELSQLPDYQCCWGGRFHDGNHFSIAHGGRK